MQLHPQIVAVLAKLDEMGVQPTQNLSVGAAREQFEALIRGREAPPVPVGDVEEIGVPGPAGPIPVRLYRPAGAGAAAPMLVYYHGGGHVIGSLDTHDFVARSLCRGADVAVASVDYRLGPEHRFPAAAEDSYAALAWLAGHAGEIGIAADRIAVGGDSAGGNLAAVAALMARDAGGPGLRHQMLVYPVADYACDSPSYETFAEGFGLEAAGMRWFRTHYLEDAAQAQDWRASPLRAADLAGLPPAHVITAECDVLHDEGVALAAALADAGVPVVHRDYPGMIHGFFGYPPEIDGAEAARADAIGALRGALHGAS